MKNKLLMQSRTLTFPVVFALLHLFCTVVVEAGDVAIEISTFDSLYEPSGVVQVKTGAVIVIEDERGTPLYFVRPQQRSERGVLARGKSLSVGVEVDDLEGITASGDSTLFAITSHSVTRKGKRKEDREQLLKLKVQNNSVTLTGEAHSIQPYVIKQLQQLQEFDEILMDAINIEGLSFDKSGKKLLVGLREPLFNGKAIVLEILNPFSLFEDNEPPLFSDQLILLDVGGSGIRAMEYFPQLKRYLVASEVTNKNGKKRSRVWAWDGTKHNSPTKVVLPKLKGIRNIEGLAPLVYENKHFLLIVCDDGKRGEEKGAHYVLIRNTEFSVN
ncbi:DUF3616 domain-containing protein [Desulfopila sp. IMCC35008]|uniref:DUF3616 domain-containing protein n=1 Tax=Desulfopila sp. IMCC35008 TaxID=2653858 RepID=UPI0013D69E1C|nr:DUF3616 domain-containing protein [Desulfopila sp. IMCC35008]